MLELKRFVFYGLVMGYASTHAQTLLPPDHIGYHQKPLGQWTLDWSADNKWIAIGGDDSLVRLYKSEDLSLAKVFRFNGMIRQVDWHPKNQKLLVASAANSLELLDVASNEVSSIKNVLHGARAVGWNYNGTLFAAADGGGIVRIWNEMGVLLQTFNNNENRSYFSLDWHPSENKLITGGDDIKIFDSESGLISAIRHREEYTGVLCVRWHPSGKIFASGDYGHHDEGIESLIQLWSDEGELKKTIRASKNEYRSISWSKDGKWLATSGDALRIWKQTGELVFEDKTNKSNNIWGISWNYDNTQLACIDFEGNLKIWITKDWTLRK